MPAVSALDNVLCRIAFIARAKDRRAARMTDSVGARSHRSSGSGGDGVLPDLGRVGGGTRNTISAVSWTRAGSRRHVKLLLVPEK